MSKNLLDISTLEPDRPTVTIDGVAYEMAVPEDFGLAQQARLGRLHRRISSVHLDADSLSEADISATETALDELVSLILPTLPAEIRAQLRDVHKRGILQAFTLATEGWRPRPPLSPTPTGEQSSPDSSASMAEIPLAG